MSEQEVFEKPLEKMTAKELRELALSIGGITGVHGMKKPELVEAIKDAKGIVDDEGGKKNARAIREAKAKIKELQAAVEKAREGGDDKLVKINRRRISRLKKSTRRLAAG
jgi:predicted ATPase